MQAKSLLLCFTDPADFQDTNLICPPPPTPPVSSKMNFSYSDVPMCPGSIANYTCIAGGINAFQVLQFAPGTTGKLGPFSL